VRSEQRGQGRHRTYLGEFGILRPEQISTLQKFSLACPAIPTCGLALTESERALPGIIDQLEAELKRLGLEDEKLTVRMTGCPNGCARPYQSDIGLVGRSGDKYTVYVGGHVLGHRLNFMLKDLVPLAQIVPTLRPLLEHFKAERRAQEGFGDYCQRQGLERLGALLPQSVETKAKTQHSGDSLISANGTNGDGHPSIEPTSGSGWVVDPPATVAALRQGERFLGGHAGEERVDYVFRYNSDGSIRPTAVYYYGADCRAAAAGSGQPLRRQALYQGRVDPKRLYNARKLSDTHYVGSSGNEQKDIQFDYNADGSVAQSVVFFYDGDARANEASSGSAVRRTMVYEGQADNLRASSGR